MSFETNNHPSKVKSDGQLCLGPSADGAKVVLVSLGPESPWIWIPWIRWYGEVVFVEPASTKSDGELIYLVDLWEESEKI